MLGWRSWGMCMGGMCVGASSWRCRIYCLMANHDQVVGDTPEASLSTDMRQPKGVSTMPEIAAFSGVHY